MSKEYEIKEEDDNNSPTAPHSTDIDTNIIRNDLEIISEDEKKSEIKDNNISITIKSESNEDIENNFEEKMIEYSGNLNGQDKSNEDIKQQEKDEYNLINSKKGKKFENSNNNKDYSEFNKKKINIKF